MKKLIYLFILFFALESYSQNRIVDIFNGILPRARYYLLLKEYNNKVSLYREHVLLDTKVMVSENGNYMTFDYQKDSLESYSFQFLVFKTSEGKEVLAIGNTKIVNNTYDGWISFTEVGNAYGGMNKIYYPWVADSVFFKENNKKEYPELYFYSEYFAYTILEDNSILIKHGYNNVDDACKNGDEKACDLLNNKLTKDIAFVWDNMLGNYVMMK